MDVNYTKSPGINSGQKNFRLWSAFVIYVLLAGYAMFHHEPWGDELHSWNIAKGSTTLSDLLYNSSYEGHPPVWYVLLWGISKLSHNPFYFQLLHLSIATAIIFLVLFHTALPINIRLLIPFGYYFLFEYAIICRNYAAGILAGLLVCIVIHKQFRYKTLVYYLLLLFMSNTHLLAMLLAASLHLYFLIDLAAQEKRKIIVFHIIAGVFIFLPSLYFIAPPSDSAFNIKESMARWSNDYLIMEVQSPLRAFVPIPAWWKYNFWNHQFLIEMHSSLPLLKVVSPLLALTIVIIAIYLLWDDKKSIILFAANLISTWIIGNFYPLTTQRYTGFLFIGFILALCLNNHRCPLSAIKTRIVISLLLIQSAAGAFITVQDIRLPFSNLGKIKQILEKPSGNAIVVTDFWGVIAGAAYCDRAYYCADLEKEASFILWNKDMTAMQKKPSRYYEGIKRLFVSQQSDTVFMFSNSSPEVIGKIDPVLFSHTQVTLITKTRGAIEQWSDLYLYRISR